MHPVASMSLQLGFIALTVVVVAGFLFAAFRVGTAPFIAVLFGTLAWLGLFAALSRSGILLRFDARPPPMAFVFVALVAVGLWVGFSRFGAALATLPLWLLVAFQSFRLPLELLMHSAADQGVMPPQMTFTGFNFDIVTGTVAIPLAVALKRGARPGWALAWNVLGSLLLLTIMVIGLVSTPLVRAFGDGAALNTWVGYFPFVYLPTVMVVFALIGHVTIFRALKKTPLPQRQGAFAPR